MSTLFTDTFDRADSTGLGANWVHNEGEWRIVSNVARPMELGDGSDGSARTDTAAHASIADMRASALLRSTLTGSVPGLIVRLTSSDTYYFGQILASGLAEIWLQNAGVWTLISTGSGGAQSTGSSYTFDVSGSTLRFFQNSSLLLSATDTSITAAGRAGFYGSATTWEWDNFVVADFASSGGVDEARQSAFCLTGVA